MKIGFVKKDPTGSLQMKRKLRRQSLISTGIAWATEIFLKINLPSHITRANFTNLFSPQLEQIFKKLHLHCQGSYNKETEKEENSVLIKLLWFAEKVLKDFSNVPFLKK